MEEHRFDLWSPAIFWRRNGPARPTKNPPEPVRPLHILAQFASPRWDLQYASTLKRYGRFDSQDAMDDFITYLDDSYLWGLFAFPACEALVQDRRVRASYRQKVQRIGALLVDHAKLKFTVEFFKRYVMMITETRTHFALAQEYNPVLRAIVRRDVPPSKNPHILRLQHEILVHLKHEGAHCGTVRNGSGGRIQLRISDRSLPRWTPLTQQYNPAIRAIVRQDVSPVQDPYILRLQHANLVYLNHERAQRCTVRKQGGGRIPKSIFERRVPRGTPDWQRKLRKAERQRELLYEYRVRRLWPRVWKTVEACAKKVKLPVYKYIRMYDCTHPWYRVTSPLGPLLWDVVDGELRVQGWRMWAD